MEKRQGEGIGSQKCGLNPLFLKYSCCQALWTCCMPVGGDQLMVHSTAWCESYCCILDPCAFLVCVVVKHSLFFYLASVHLCSWHTKMGTCKLMYDAVWHSFILRSCMLLLCCMDELLCVYELYFYSDVCNKV